MYSYALLEPECYYIVQESEKDESLTLLQVKVVSDNCMYVMKYGDGLISEWKRKTAPIYDIIEVLDDEAAKQWNNVYNNGADAYNYEEDEE